MKETLASRSDTVTLTQCLQLFTEPETLSKDEAWLELGYNKRDEDSL